MKIYNEEVTSGDYGTVLDLGPCTRQLVSGARDINREAVAFRRKYAAFIHPSSVSTLRQKYPDCVRNVSQRFVVLANANGDRRHIFVPRDREILLLPDHRNEAWGSHCVYLAGIPAVEPGDPLLSYGGKWSQSLPRDPSYVVSVFDWYLDAKDAWLDSQNPSYGGQVQDAFQLSEDEHSARLAALGSGSLEGKPPCFHYIVSNFSLAASAAKCLSDCALLLTCAYGDEYWMTPARFQMLGEDQLKAAVANEARWQELERFLNGRAFCSGFSPYEILKDLRVKLMSGPQVISVTELRRSAISKRDFKKEALVKAARCDRLDQARTLALMMRTLGK